MAYLQEFRDTYLGAYATAPTTDPDGNPVNAGDLYFDTTLNEVRVYDTSSVWKSAGATVNGTSKRETFTGDGVTTVFTITGGYDALFADVYVNGVKVVNGVDVDVSSGTDVVFAAPPASGDVIDVVAYGSFQLADMYTKAEIDAGTVVLNGIKNVDGAGSGLDADLYRGLDARTVLQHVHAFAPADTEVLNTSAATFADTGMLVAITPKTLAGKLFVRAVGTFKFYTSNDGVKARIEMSTDGGVTWAPITTNTNVSDALAYRSDSASSNNLTQITLYQSVAPTALTEVQFKVTFAPYTDAGDAFFNTYWGTGCIEVMEVMA